uniref:Uncharacterized protein n=1 Tax=Chromera velia CCMP2878 TaxID=1169474 RepID=A0A0G4G4K0_9ALVE|eukprot:Cvel_571.t1-p1 / transcript=Cvel_571.t1 / gene=Cvel_571 / organism=Chromera_velia_CCMP2878 / gene_product=hypothetical protein / transcript_product=hypothetical protein / location=Cvel_scaffold17:194638-196680(+) / protein_length=145 / sequence_SO=supercontig / SO=protein_coding / is_pseudo=false
MVSLSLQAYLFSLIPVPAFNPAELKGREVGSDLFVKRDLTWYLVGASKKNQPAGKVGGVGGRRQQGQGGAINHRATLQPGAAHAVGGARRAGATLQAMATRGGKRNKGGDPLASPQTATASVGGIVEGEQIDVDAEGEGDVEVHE